MCVCACVCVCVWASMCEKNVQAHETPLGQKALEREEHVLGAERRLLYSEGNLSFITFAELDELQSLHLQRDLDCNSGAFAHPYCNSSTGWGQERTLGPSKMGSTGQNLYKAEAPHPAKKTPHLQSKRVNQQKPPNNGRRQQGYLF